jgi:hypothetical protein
MKQIITFEIDDSEEFDKEKLRRILKVDNSFSAIWEIQKLLLMQRSQAEDSPEEHMMEEVLKDFFRILEKNNIDLDYDYT